MAVTTGVQASFQNDAALQDAVARLTLLGFDRADLTVPNAVAAEPGSETAGSAPGTDTDARQARTLATSMAGAVGAMAAAGAVIATGGAAAVAAAAAAAVGAGAAGVANLGGDAVDASNKAERDAAAERGALVLTVNARSEEEAQRAASALRDAGGALVAIRSADGEVGPAPV